MVNILLMLFIYQAKKWDKNVDKNIQTYVQICYAPYNHLFQPQF